MENLRDNCNKCEQDTPITPESAYLVRFSRCFGNFILNKCVHCGYETRLFTVQDTEDVFIQKGIPVAETDVIPEPEFIEQYLDLFEIPLPKEEELTPRQDKYVSNMGQFLQKIEVTADDFVRAS